jgi:CheY-like chemotaxis protein
VTLRHPITIAVFEQEPDTRAVLAFFLGARGHASWVCDGTSGARQSELLAATLRVIDVVLWDLSPPGPLHLRLLRDALDQGALGDAALVVTTTDPLTLHQAAPDVVLRAHRVLAKPYDLQNLLEALEGGARLRARGPQTTDS